MSIEVNEMGNNLGRKDDTRLDQKRAIKLQTRFL